jgi:CopG family transcriptional regulator, nickel-responsive regulator
MAERVTRFGVSLPKSLLSRFDKTLTELGYENRSKAVCDALHDFLLVNRLTQAGPIVGTLSYIYDHHVGDVNRRLLELQHGFTGQIISTMHAHISRNDCVEVLIIQCEAVHAQKLYGGISAIKGVRNCKISLLDKTG